MSASVTLNITIDNNTFRKAKNGSLLPSKITPSETYTHKCFNIFDMGSPSDHSFINTPKESEYCVTHSAKCRTYGIFSIALHLETPNPLLMGEGMYEGTPAYSAADSGADIELGGGFQRP